MPEVVVSAGSGAVGAVVGSVAHTGAIFVEIEGRPNPDAPAIATRWIERLDDLATRIKEDRIEELRVADGFPNSDGVSVEHVRRHRPSLEDAIASSRAHFAKLARPGAAPEGAAP